MVWFFFSAVMTSIFLPGSWSVTVPTYVSTLPLTVPPPVSVFVSVFASSVLPTCFDSWVVFTSPWEVWVVDSDLRSTVPGSFEQAKAETRNAAPSALTRKEYLRSCMMFMPPNGLKAGTVPAVISGRHGRVRGGRSLPALGADRPAEKGEPVGEDELHEEERPRPQKRPGGDVVCELHTDVHVHPRRKERDLAQTRGPRDLKDRKEQEPQGLAHGRVADEARLPAVRNVGIELVNTLVGVVLQVVRLKGDRARQDVRKVGRDGGDPVPTRASEQEVVGALVDEDPKGMIQKRSDREGHDEAGPERSTPEDGGECGLRQDDSDHEKDAPRVSPRELADLRVTPEDLARTKRVRLTLVGEEKVLGTRIHGSFHQSAPHQYRRSCG